jgi:diacylglycerol kinase family enzyme
MSTSVSVVFNEGSGTKSTCGADLEAVFARHGLQATIVCPNNGSDVASVVASIVSSGSDIVVAAGGDGTVSAVASAVAGSDAVLGVLPLGTLNHFAKDAGVPLELEEAVRNISTGRVVKVDVGEVNGRAFINNISLGLYPAFVQARGNVRKLTVLGRWWTIVSAAVISLVRLPLFRSRLQIDSRPLKRITPVLFVGNNEYELDGKLIGGRRSLDRGCLSLVVTRSRGPWGLIKLVVRAALGKLRGAKDLDAMLGREIEIRTKDRRTMLAIDGEVIEKFDWPLRCSVRPGALRLLVPEERSAEGQS